MRCKNIKEKLADYVLQRCEPAERAELDNHLKGCPDCQHLLEEEKRLCLFFKDFPAPLPQRDLWPVISHRLDQRRRSFSLWEGTLPRRWALVLTPLILTVGLWLGYQQRGNPPVHTTPHPTELILALPPTPDDPVAETTEDFLALLEYTTKE